MAEMGKKRQRGHGHVDFEVNRSTEALGLKGLGVAGLCHDLML